MGLKPGPKPGLRRQQTGHLSEESPENHRNKKTAAPAVANPIVTYSYYFFKMIYSQNPETKLIQVNHGHIILSSYLISSKTPLERLPWNLAPSALLPCFRSSPAPAQRESPKIPGWHFPKENMCILVKRLQTKSPLAKRSNLLAA